MGCMAGPKRKTVGSYLAALPSDQRTALQRLRKIIRAAVPQGEECICYGIPAFRLNGKFLVAYAAAAGHCSFYPGSYVQGLSAELKKYEVGKGTIRFQPDQPLPPALVRRLMRGRIAKMMKVAARRLGG